MSEVMHTSVGPMRSAIQSSAASALSPTRTMLTFDMPGGRIGRLLDEEVGGPAQEIRPVEILNRIEDSAMADELRQPSEK